MNALLLVPDPHAEGAEEKPKAANEDTEAHHAADPSLDVTDPALSIVPPLTPAAGSDAEAAGKEATPEVPALALAPPPAEAPRAEVAAVRPVDKARIEKVMVVPAGRYQAVKKIADGGTAELFVGEHVGATGYRRRVALKRLHAALVDKPEHNRLLLEEAHVAMGLSHGNLVEVRDIGITHGRHFLVLELVEGWSLARLLERGRAAGLPMPPRAALHVAAEVARGLSHAHDHGVVHCDVCPHNILIAETGEVKLTDFGIARSPTRPLQRGVIAGKPQYMSPEQAAGEQVDARSDVFSLGSVLFHALTDVMPVKGDSDEEVLERVARGDFVTPMKARPSLQKEIGQLLLSARASERWARYQTAHDLLAALELVMHSNARGELERWLGQLYEADREQPPTRERTAPVVNLRASRTPITRRTVAPRRRMWWAAVAAGVLALGADRAWRLWGSAAAQTASFAATSVQPMTAKVAPAPTVASAGASMRLPTMQLGEVDVVIEEEAPPVIQPLPVREGVAVREPQVLRESAPAYRDEPALREPPPDYGRLKVSGRVLGSYDQDRVMVMFDSEPRGADVIVDSRVLGTTPVALRFRTGIPFEVNFEREGEAGLTKWMTVERPQHGSPRVVFEEPKPRH
ncbi:MAG: serine/threonine protein kinase [Archangiaceae bacterium]|nr:serine/threonine protein kinase [Archangiaceae bacterium]